ncbi:MAG: GIY-YIG nuclease family protein [Lachnospiraceae bacterium]|nr:GIY-YIG nuclease family protein [Lachnospiraceae bacterium]
MMRSVKNESNWCVYIRTNKINGKKYIGISTNPERRWKNGTGYIGQFFGTAIQKYGKERQKSAGGYKWAYA